MPATLLLFEHHLDAESPVRPANLARLLLGAECRPDERAARPRLPERAEHPVGRRRLRQIVLRQRAAGDDGLLRAAVDASELC